VSANRIIFPVLGGCPEVRVGLDVVSFDPRHHQKLQHSCFHVLLFFYPPTTGEILMQYPSNIFIIVESQCVSFLMFFSMNCRYIFLQFTFHAMSPPTVLPPARGVHL
jgi:hypothetical protein